MYVGSRNAVQCRSHAQKYWLINKKLEEKGRETTSSITEKFEEEPVKLAVPSMPSTKVVIPPDFTKLFKIDRDLSLYSPYRKRAYSESL